MMLLFFSSAPLKRRRRRRVWAVRGVGRMPLMSRVPCDLLCSGRYVLPTQPCLQCRSLDNREEGRADPVAPP